MTYFALSIIGLISVDRIICKLEKYFFINRKNTLSLFVFLTVPIYFFVVIKEQLLLFTLFIGLNLLSLIFFSLILEKKLKKVFLASYLNVLNGIILQIKAGSSPQRAISESADQLTPVEKIVFEPLKWVLKHDLDINNTIYPWTRFYFYELRVILKSDVQLAQQLEMFKQGLKVKNKFILRTQQVSRQIKAQALVAAMIYGLIFALSYVHLRLMDNILTVFISASLFITGLLLIFKLGNRIRWTI